MINELKEYIKNTPLDQLRKEWKDVEEFSEIGPSALELIEHWKSTYFWSDILHSIDALDKGQLKNQCEKDSKFMGSFFLIYI